MVRAASVSDNGAVSTLTGGRSGSALTHGLTARQVLAEEDKQYAEALEMLKESEKPGDPYQASLVRRVGRPLFTKRILCLLPTAAFRQPASRPPRLTRMQKHSSKLGAKDMR